MSTIKGDAQTDQSWAVDLPLQKLIHLHSSSDSDSDDSDDEKRAENPRPRRKPSFWSWLRRSKAEREKDEPPKPMDMPADVHDPTNGFITAHVSPSTESRVTHLRTLQRYHGGPDEERIQFMENHSALASKNLGVSVEQVSSMWRFIDPHSCIFEIERHCSSAHETFALILPWNPLVGWLFGFPYPTTGDARQRSVADLIGSFPHSGQHSPFVLRELGGRHRNTNPIEAEHSRDYPSTLSGCLHDGSGMALKHEAIESD